MWDEHLDKQFKALIDAYIYSGREPIKDEGFECLDNRPSISTSQKIENRIIAKKKEFVAVLKREWWRRETHRLIIQSAIICSLN
jgi:type I restriction enzyme R subunit